MPPVKTKSTETVTVLKTNVKALADNIAELSKVGEALKNSRLKQRAMILLIKDVTTNLTYSDIEQVLNALPQLEARFLK